LESTKHNINLLKAQSEGLAGHTMSCPFCKLDSSRVILENEHAVVVYDGYPVSPGHSLIIPKRHISSFFETDPEERSALLQLLDDMRMAILRERKPDGFNVGINDGEVAGQTVLHLHIHLIPRYLGDMPDPRGGIRWLFPDKAIYWQA
jgi:diadenosine tetraphosphate (Ap4A) HIT family hydrolase